MESIYNKYSVYRRWLEDQEGYWREFLEKTSNLIYWAKKPDQIFEWNPPQPFRWFTWRLHQCWLQRRGLQGG